ncbi:MAG: hypothetical protein ACO2O0_13910 [Desulfurococcales archaeon]
MIKPAKKGINVEELRDSLRRHVEKLKDISTRKELRPGELAKIYLEEEFEE